MLCCRRARDEYEIQEALARKEKKRIHDQIEKELKAEEKSRQREHRILLLGCGEAGKSTFIKQMRIIHSDGFTTQERMDIKSDIACNIISAIQTLLLNCNSAWEDQELEDDARLIESLPQHIQPRDLLEHTSIIKRLWETQEIQATYENRNQFQLIESAKYFLTRAEEVLKPDYLPTNQDIVQTRVKTTGIIEHDFEINDKETRTKRKLILIDVGGQRSERKKWIHCFEEVLLILFLTAISEYDQVLAEDEETNRIQESLRLFSTILNYQWFKNTNVILFLNKVDLLREKIGKSPLKNHFPNYNGPENNADSAIDFFADSFTSLNPNPQERKLFIHETCATDTENIKVVNVIVQHTIMETILSNTMIN